jgi:hypothetical protein
VLAAIRALDDELFVHDRWYAAGHIGGGFSVDCRA